METKFKQATEQEYRDLLERWPPLLKQAERILGIEVQIGWLKFVTGFMIGITIGVLL